jgi:hypothetical protein
MAGGSCLCGEVAFELVRSADSAKFRWVRGEAQVSNYGPPKDWHFGTAFCRQCGSTLPRVVRSVGIVVVPAGTLDGDPDTRPTGHGFADSKAEWFPITDDLPQYAGMPPAG